MQELIFATHNEHKAREVKELLPKGYLLKTLTELGYHREIEETGTTLKANAEIKARTVFEFFGKACFADDTGLMVEALGGRPGVYSARYAWSHATFDENVNKLLLEMKDEKRRTARFVTVICYVDRLGQSYFTEGSVEGVITRNRAGEEGFGYDPVFLPDGAEQTFAQMDADAKNKISHRGRALQNFREFLAGLNQKN